MEIGLYRGTVFQYGHDIFSQVVCSKLWSFISVTNDESDTASLD